MRTLFLVLILAGCGGSESPPGNGGKGEDWGHEKRPDPVTVIEIDEAKTGTVVQTLVTSAVVESESSADIFPQTSGVVVSVKKDEGDFVRRGEVLAVLENVSLESGAERASAELAKVTKEVNELQGLFERGAISQKELEEAHFRLVAAQTSNREAANSAGFQKLTAPFDGVVAARDVRRGELATSGKRAFSVVDLDELRVVASLPERDLGSVQLEQRAKLVSAYNTEIWAMGSVGRIAPIVDATSGTFRATIHVDGAQDSLRPGQFVSVELIVDQHEDVLVVAREAIVYEDGAPVVYRMIPEPEKDPEEGDEDGDKEGGDDEPGWAVPSWLAGVFGGEEEGDEADEEDPDALPRYVAQRVSVKLGLVDSVSAEVAQGIELGDKVITVGQSNLRDEAPVRTPAMQREAKALEDARKEAAKDEEKSGAEG